ncbi:MAG: adenosylcobinamide amidohydrolase, partial [Thermoplasmata archaeon]|nr:adenosylcobinamide amidohydrolase [Thermoplasmata archaeon]
PMEALSCAVMNGGTSTVSALFIMQVPKNYDCADPDTDTRRVRDALGLPEDTMGMMTAAEVEHVFNVREAEYNGIRAAAIATAGLSNHVVAGEVLDDYAEKSAVSARRAAALHAGTINIAVVSPIPLTTEGKVNLLIPLVEAKSVAMAEHGFAETGTTSDAMAVLCPSGEPRATWTGTGSDVGIAAARAVSAAVDYALDARDEHPIPITPKRMLERMGLDSEALRKMSGSAMGPEEYAASLESLLSREDVAALADMAWNAAYRIDSVAQDGDRSQMEVFLGTASRIIGTEPTDEGSLMDCVVTMIARKAGGLRWQREAP